MRKAAFIIIFATIITAVFLLTFGTVSQNAKTNEALVEVNNAKKQLLITPSGNTDAIILPEIITFRGLKYESLEVGGQVRTDMPIIYVDQDYDKDIYVIFSTMWGKKKYEVNLILTHYIKFYVDNQLVGVVSKDNVGRNEGLPAGNYEWFIDKDLSRPFDPLNLRDTLALYASSR